MLSFVNKTMLQQIFHLTKHGMKFHLLYYSLTYFCYLQLVQHGLYNGEMDDMPPQVVYHVVNCQ
jgi:hypothetical protein